MINLKPFQFNLHYSQSIFEKNSKPFVGFYSHWVNNDFKPVNHELKDETDVVSKLPLKGQLYTNTLTLTNGVSRLVCALYITRCSFSDYKGVLNALGDVSTKTNIPTIIYQT